MERISLHYSSLSSSVVWHSKTTSGWVFQMWVPVCDLILTDFLIVCTVLPVLIWEWCYFTLAVCSLWFFSPHSFVYGYLCLATGGSGWHLHLRSGQALCHQGNGCPFWRVHCPGMHWNMKWQTGCCLGQSCQICSLPKLKDCNSACTHWLQGIHTGSFHSLWHHGGWAPRWVARWGYWP